MPSIIQFAIVPGRARSSRASRGHPPLSQSLVQLAPADDHALSLANAFVDRLAEFTPAQWLDVGRHVVTNHETVALHARARAIMDATIANRSLGLAAWHVRDAVETIAYLASHCGPNLSRQQRRHFAAARAGAEDAALAVLTREHLAPEEFAALCSPINPNILGA
jgi:hypothetical protein